MVNGERAVRSAPPIGPGPRVTGSTPNQASELLPPTNVCLADPLVRLPLGPALAGSELPISRYGDTEAPRRLLDRYAGAFPISAQHLAEHRHGGTSGAARVM